MTAPATKRRKLAHSNGSDHSEASFEDEISDDGNSGAVAYEGEEGVDNDDNSVDNVDELEYEGLEEDDSPQSEPGEELNDVSNPQGRSHKLATNGDTGHFKAPHRRKEMVAHQDGVYTAEVYKSNVFKLQVDELLQEVKPKYGKKEAPAENAMRTLKTSIEQLPSRPPQSIAIATKALKSEGITIPFPDPLPPKDAQYKLQYDRPALINATGSYPLKIATRADEGLAIDLVVTMPKPLFQEKDYLNHRYFYKRAYYLACIASGIAELKEHKFKLTFELLNGNHLLPILVVRSGRTGGPDDFTSSKCRINILLALPENYFATSKLLPTYSCIRPKSNDEGIETKPLKPTPFYNSSVQSDASITSYLKLLHSTSSRCDAYKDACVLGRIWLKQRGFGSSLRKGGFGNFEWAAVMASLLSPNQGAGAPALSPGFSSYQLFKATLQFLASHNLSKSPYKFQAHDVALPKGDGQPVFFDGPRNLNVLFKMTSWSWSKLQSEAKSTIEMLADPKFDQFESTFILKADAVKFRYDMSVAIPLSALDHYPDNESDNERLLKTISKLYSALCRALTDRISMISFTLPEQSSWSISSRPHPNDQERHVVVNLDTNPGTANRSVDHGPSAESKREAAAFRQFWGDKAELRRFKDGSILESVVWSLKDTSKSVLEQIVLFVLERHVSAQVAGQAEINVDSFAHLISSGRIQGASGVASFTARMNAFAALEQDVRNLEGMPLRIRHISAADPLLRYSAIDPGSAIDPNATQASLIVQFEGSARWPDDLCAIQRTKIAFLLKLSDLLSAEKSKYISRVGLENISQPSQNQGYLDIILSSGFSFRLRIHHDREATLLERQLMDKSLDGQSRESAAAALATYKRDYLHIPAHTRAIQTLCTRFPALSPSIRLTKRWFASHLLAAHFSPEFIELLVVRTFLQPYPWPVPSCASTGFLRTLAWIGRWDWRHTPLIVDFPSITDEAYGELEGAATKTLKTEDIDKIKTRLEAWRCIDPAMNRVVLFAATNLDPEGTTWTDRAKPERVVASRMTTLARAATQLVRTEEARLLSLVNDEGKDRKVAPLVSSSLFVPALGDFDIVIDVVSKYSKRGKKKSGPKYKNLQIQEGPENVQSVGFEPVQLFVEELQGIYGDGILWFYDPDTADTVCGLWNPSVTAQRAWKVKPGWNSTPVSAGKAEKESDEKTVDIQLNKGAVCSEVKRIGGDLVDRIQVK
ncbi:pre-rRNA processing protein Utp22 [Lophiotrema nucula]|uniref:U3 small nucleolar RNA-associated protein 22 n=1 Tax=Lophiotrema nucula TaxID=690887 RepID=A0A6A5ZSI5_9PLEO|nr:pre-rRNA processing protein Utp22 [Lophiotrema nucula]